jgi:hypothetical protein
MAPRTPKDPEAKAAKPAKSAKAMPAAEKPALRVVETGAEAPPAKAGSLKLKDMVDQVAEATGGKKSDVKPVIEAMLKVMGTALATGTPLAVAPLGKLRVVKNKGPALTLKLRLADAPKAAGLALADDDEDS